MNRSLELAIALVIVPMLGTEIYGFNSGVPEFYRGVAFVFCCVCLAASVVSACGLALRAVNNDGVLFMSVLTAASTASLLRAGEAATTWSVLGWAVVLSPLFYCMFYALVVLSPRGSK